MNWTKEPAASQGGGTLYRHTNGATLHQSARGTLWTAGDSNNRGAFMPESSAMSALAGALREADRRSRGVVWQPEYTLTVAQLVEAISDLHTGGLP